MLINKKLVQTLIQEQFPQWRFLQISDVKIQGHDNRTFRLGNDMLVRLPSAQCYADKVGKEQIWLPELQKHVSITISCPLAMGNPSKSYPWSWSIYGWIEGESANNFFPEKLDLSMISTQLSQFLQQLHQIDTTGAPIAGTHNFYRGGSLKTYDHEVCNAVAQLHHIIDVEKVLEVWQKALNSQWSCKAVWIHGDLSDGNILIQDKKLVGVIDFGGMAVGDPACDLVIAWTFLHGKSRENFKQKVNLDSSTWDRARGWALWKALITLTPLQGRNSQQAKKQLDIIYNVVAEAS